MKQIPQLGCSSLITQIMFAAGVAYPMPILSECSPDRPWGFHPEVVDNLCPRCGWCAGGSRQPEPELSAPEEAAL
jgi:hypothetical protein